MASIRNIVVEDQGVAWEVTFEYSNDAQTDPWQSFTARFPRDFAELSPIVAESMFSNLGMEVARAQGVIE